MSDGLQALAIANLKARYCRAADTAAGDPDTARALFADLFTEEFVGDYGGALCHGPHAAIDFLCDAIHGSSVWMIHMLQSPLIEIAGDRATGEWTLIAQSRRRGNGGAPGELSIVVGRYADVFHLTPSGWRIARIEFSRPE